MARLKRVDYTGSEPEDKCKDCYLGTKKSLCTSVRREGTNRLYFSCYEINPVTGDEETYVFIESKEGSYECS